VFESKCFQNVLFLELLLIYKYLNPNAAGLCRPGGRIRSNFYPYGYTSL
jgi:hypothetical protein